jgi:transposase
VITVEDWALIRQLHRVEGLSQAAIARKLSLSRNTVAKAIRSADPPGYRRRPPVEGAFSEVEAAVRDLLGRFPSMPTAVIAERVGWTGSRSWFYANVARLRPGYQLADPADRLVHHPGEQIQCDLWFPGRLIPDHAGVARDFPVLVMVASHSRYATAVLLPTRRTGDLLAGMWWCLAEGFGAVPRQLLWDNEAGIGRGGKLAEGVAAFCGALGVRLVQARPYDPSDQGRGGAVQWVPGHLVLARAYLQHPG